MEKHGDTVRKVFESALQVADNLRKHGDTVRKAFESALQKTDSVRERHKPGLLDFVHLAGDPDRRAAR